MSSNKNNLTKTGGGPLQHIDINADELNVIVPNVTVHGDPKILETQTAFVSTSIILYSNRSRG